MPNFTLPTYRSYDLIVRGIDKNFDIIVSLDDIDIEEGTCLFLKIDGVKKIYTVEAITYYPIVRKENGVYYQEECGGCDSQKYEVFVKECNEGEGEND
jgi:hypothetical protein